MVASRIIWPRMWHFGDSLFDEFRVHVQATSNRGRSHLRWDTAKGREVKKILLATTALLALGMAPAIAADLGARPYTKAPAAAIAINNWTGFYIGAMGGYAEENSSGIGTLSGGFAGGTAGYNWQTGNVVLGIEADAAWADVGTSVGIVPGLASLDYTIRSMGTVRGRIGYTFNQVLLYGTGGYAWSDNRFPATALGVSVSDSQFHSGWTLGAGVEVMFAPKWSVKAEYLYRSLDGETYFTGIVPGGLPVGTINLNSVQVGVNYHF
jgi:outer membrane immunogenic protein